MGLERQGQGQWAQSRAVGTVTALARSSRGDALGSLPI